MREITVISVEGFGLLAVDKEKNIIWEWHHSPHRVAGFDFDHKTHHFFVATFTHILEINQHGEALWSYSHPKMADLHSLQLLPNGNILVASAMSDRAVEINKKQGIIWEWHMKDWFIPPEWYSDHLDWRSLTPERRWTHLNHAWRVENDDTLISLCLLGKVLRVNRRGEVLWSWGEGVLKSPHYIIPKGDNYLVADSQNEPGHNRILEITKEGRVVRCYGPDDYDLATPRAVEVLENGNLLITNSHKRLALPPKVLEITEKGELVWEYAIPESILNSTELPRPYCSIRLKEWKISENREFIIEHLKALGYF